MECAVQHIPYSTKFWRGKTLANLAKRMPFANILPSQIPGSPIVASVSYCKFANIFLTKLIKRSIRQSFTPPKFCAILYVVNRVFSLLLHFSSAAVTALLPLDHSNITVLPHQWEQLKGHMDNQSHR